MDRSRHNIGNRTEIRQARLAQITTVSVSPLSLQEIGTKHTIQDDCVLWGRCIIIPIPGREQLLSLLHDGHPGILKMKALARSYVWWAKIDVDIEAQVKRRNQYQLNLPSPPVVPMHP